MQRSRKSKNPHFGGSFAEEEHGPRHVTQAGQSVFHDLFDAEEAIELEIRATLLRGLEDWLAGSGVTQTEAATVLDVTQARVSDIKRGKVSQFSADLLVRLAARAGLRPEVEAFCIYTITI
jgi:predicted XRE-type DNA-binding protein